MDPDTIISAFDALPQAVLLLDRAGRVLRVNAACRRSCEKGDLFGGASGASGRLFADIVPGAVAEDSVADYTARAIRQGVTAVALGGRSEYRHPPHRPSADSERWFTVAARALPDGGAVVTYSDVTDIQEEQAEIEFHATHDALTGLLNRYAFFERADQVAELARRHRRPLHLYLLDLDGFKPVNDHFGHHAGDYALAQLARRLRESVRRSDLVARFGGDEFLVLAETEAPAELERRLRDAVAAPLHVDGREIALGVSVGRAGSGEADEIEALVRIADDRMYDEKFAGDGRDDARGAPPRAPRASRGRYDAATTSDERIVPSVDDALSA